jgi:hypothetical protein
MPFPSTTISTDNLDSETDNPATARADLLDAVQKLNTIIAGAGTASNVVLSDGSNYISTSQIPPTITVSGTMTLSPSTGIVNIQDILRVTMYPVETILTITGNVSGDMIMCSNIGNIANNPGIAFYDGNVNVWRTLAFSSNTFANI